MKDQDRALSEISERIIGCAFTVSNSLGTGFPLGVIAGLDLAIQETPPKREYSASIDWIAGSSPAMTIGVWRSCLTLTGQSRDKPGNDTLGVAELLQVHGRASHHAN